MSGDAQGPALEGEVQPVSTKDHAGAGCWVCLLPVGEALPVIGQQPVGQGRDGLVEPPDIGDEYGQLAVPDVLQDAPDSPVDTLLRIGSIPVHGNLAI